ncbi:alpha/beta hydrolase family protein [Dictyobacter aurantiacus]|uniref:BD-FAE-like domain-containing protein n=1 Tax=Dictyobacter aurantiacus TaxID=1936993 RepID=A0A401Z8X3_9CHLR|nr:prolyl oligopeptidase family serine peptidase [Dictyobacter aurantiacus]GCE03314.1 hypothetical protein KDAU_06430 [Dictyobacter aurantiacus]
MTQQYSADEQAPEDLRRRPVVYTIPEMEKVEIQTNITYKTVEDTALKLDVYYPPHYQKQTALPAVIFIHGDGPADFLKDIKDSGQYTSWGKLIAASGLIAVVANHRSTEGLNNVVGVANDVDDLMTYIREHHKRFHINANRLGIWTCSGGAPFGLRSALYETPKFIRCIVCYYGFVELKAYYQGLYGETNYSAPVFSEEDFDEFSASDLLLRRTRDIAPLFIARAGLDYAELNAALDGFIGEALSQNVALTVMNHPTGQHAFDVLDADARTEEIIEETLEFLQTHLLQ